MAIIGIERLVYGVDNVEESSRFFGDFGLRELGNGPDGAEFGLVNGARVVVLPLGHPALPRGGGIVGQGVQEVIWGVDTPSALEELRARLEKVVREIGRAHV